MKVTDTLVEQSFYPVHVCTNEEFARFYPVENSSSTKVKNLKAEDQFLCLDIKELDLDLYGSWRSQDSYTSIEPAFSHVPQLFNSTMVLSKVVMATVNGIKRWCKNI